MNGQEDHPHVPSIPFTPFTQQTTAANDSTPIPIDIDDVHTETGTMPTMEEMQSLAAAQADQLKQAHDMITRQQQQMVDAESMLKQNSFVIRLSSSVNDNKPSISFRLFFKL